MEYTDDEPGGVRSSIAALSLPHAFMQAMRLFVGEPVWTPINRGLPADDLASRKKYIDAFLKPGQALSVT